MKIYIESLKNNIKCALEFRKTFILSVISQFGVFFSYYFLLLALFQRFSNIRGFTIYEVLLCFGVIHFGFAFNETFLEELISLKILFQMVHLIDFWLDLKE